MPNGSNGRGTKRRERAGMEVGSGNVFADLGIPRPDLALAKAELVQQLQDRIDERKLSEAKAAKLLGVDQSKLIALVRGRTDGYTIDRLLRFLNLLGQSVDIVVRSTSTESTIRAETRVVVA